MGETSAQNVYREKKSRRNESYLAARLKFGDGPAFAIENIHESNGIFLQEIPIIHFEPWTNNAKLLSVWLVFNNH